MKDDEVVNTRLNPLEYGIEHLMPIKFEELIKMNFGNIGRALNEQIKC